MPDRLVRIVVDAQVAGAIRNLGQTEVALQKVAAEGTKTSTATGAAGAGIDKAGASASRAATGMSATAKAFLAVGAAAAGLKIADYIRDSVGAASDLNETVSKSQQIFGPSAAAVSKWGDTAAKALGLSKASALEAASNFGNMFTQLGYTGKAAADLSTKVVQMSADLGSFNNLGTEDVADRISAAFRGEYDSLQLLIPNISAARVQTEAMAATGKTNAESLTAQEKAAAVLAIVQRDGAAAMGDFARTSDGFANSSKSVAAAFEDQKAALGEKLLPVAKTFLSLISDYGIPALAGFGDVLGVAGAAIEPLIRLLGGVLTTFTNLPGPIQTAVIAFTAVTLLRGPLSNLGSVVEGLGAKAKTFGATIKGVFVGNPIGLAITAIATAFSLFSSSSDDATAATVSFTDAIDANTGALRDNAKETVAKALADAGVGDKLRAAGVDMGTFTDAVMGNQAAMDQLNGMYDASVANQNRLTEAFAKGGTAATDGSVPLIQMQAVMDLLGSSSSTLAADQQRVKDALDGAGGAAADAGDAAAGAVGPTKDLAAAWADGKTDAGDMAQAVQDVLAKLDELATRNGDAEAAQRDLNAQIRDYLDAQLGVPDAQRAVEQATADVAKAQDDLNTAIKDYGAESPQATQAARDLAGAQDDLTKKTQDVGQATDDAAQSSADMKQKMIEAGTQAYANAVAQGNLADASDAAKVAMQGVRDSFINMQPEAVKAADKADDVADSVGLIPDDATVKIIADTQSALTALGNVLSAVQSLPSNKSVTVTVGTRNVNLTGGASAANNLGNVLGAAGVGWTGGKVGDLIRGYVEGGLLPGIAPSNPRVDNLWGMVDGGPLIKVRSGEFIMSEPAVQRLGVGALTAMNAGGTPDVRYADAARYATASVSRTAAAVTVNPNVRVFIGETELTDMVRVVVDGAPLSGAKWVQGARAAERV